MAKIVSIRDLGSESFRDSDSLDFGELGNLLVRMRGRMDNMGINYAPGFVSYSFTRGRVGPEVNVIREYLFPDNERVRVECIYDDSREVREKALTDAYNELVMAAKNCSLKVVNGPHKSGDFKYRLTLGRDPRLS